MPEKKWTGDKGETTLRGGMKTSKNSLRVDAYGTLDELNAFIGLTRFEANDPQIAAFLEDIQKDLFAISADLATPLYEKVKRIDSKRTQELEHSFNTITSRLENIENFIIPGGGRSAALLHICRTICRRAEREIVSLHEQEPINDEVLKYMNRLSDVFFQLARLENKRGNVKEKIWKE